MKAVAVVRQNNYDSAPTIIQLNSAPTIIQLNIYNSCSLSILDHTYSCLNWYATSNTEIVCMYVHTSMYMCIECMCVYAACVHVIMPLCAFVCVCVCVHMHACVSVCKRELVSTSLLNAME